MICKYGCGREAVHRANNGSWICGSHPSSCPIIRQKKADKLSGLSRPPEVVQRIVESNKKTWMGKKRVPWNKGLKGAQTAWNKGNVKREPVSAPKDDVFASLKRYRNRVSVRTQRTYSLFKEEINPYDYPRGKCGIPGAWQLDHITSVREGFEKRIPVDVISAKENLQMLPWLENIRKYDK